MADVPVSTEPLCAEADRIEEDTLYSAKGHFEAAKDWNKYHLCIGLPTTVLAALGAGLVRANTPLITGILAALVAVGSALLTFLKPSERASQHTHAGNAYKAVSNRARIFRQVDCRHPNAQLDVLTTALKKLATERDELNLKSPIIPASAFARARKGIEGGEASYRVDHKA